jgi:hypothetical protein
MLVLIADVLTSLLLRSQAAAEYLLKCGLEGLKGVVYLDEMDRQMVLLRKGLKVVKLADSGLAWNERFTFYDQVLRIPVCVIDSNLQRDCGHANILVISHGCEVVKLVENTIATTAVS